MTRSFPELSARPTLRVLSNEQIENLHLATLEVLERTEVRIAHKKALELFDGAGAKVDRDRVRIPAAVIEKAIQQSQVPLVLGSRNGEIAVSLENGRSWFGAGLDCPQYLDPTTGTRRYPYDDYRFEQHNPDEIGRYRTTKIRCLSEEFADAQGRQKNL